MKRYDMHVHAQGTEAMPEKLLADMDKAGIYGGCIFSNWPKRANEKLGTSFDARLDEVLTWTKDHRDRLFPVLWIHPYEDDIIEKIHLAAAQEVMAFKMICTDFYVYEDRCMRVLAEIAALGKPVFFHSGILWDGSVSSKYNRPLNWEALLDIDNLRFSMGHCSWPWHDECIALYGKFLNAVSHWGRSAKMFFDITPGTPVIYREELLRKIFTIGYEVSDHIMFGSDASADAYNSSCTAEWLNVDGRIMDSLGITEQVREKIYCDNLQNFLGLKGKNNDK